MNSTETPKALDIVVILTVL